MSVVVRPARASDAGFIVDTWRNSFALSSELAAFDRDMFYALAGRDIGALLRAPETTALIACDADDDDALVGYAVLTGPVLHYVYVRGGGRDKSTNFRKLGVARMLLEGQPVERFSFRTDAFMRRVKPEQRGWTYEPRKVSWLNGKLTVEIAA